MFPPSHGWLGDGKRFRALDDRLTLLPLTQWERSREVETGQVGDGLGGLDSGATLLGFLEASARALGRSCGCSWVALGALLDALSAFLGCS